MKILVLWVSLPLVLLGSLLSSTSAEEGNKDHSKAVLSKVHYVGEDSSELRNKDVYSGTNTVNRYGGLPNNYGDFTGQREILRNRFRGSDGSSKDENRADDGYKNDQGTGGSSYPYRGFGEPDETENGVFSNPFLGERRRTYNSSPDYGTTEDGAQPGYGRPYYGGSYLPRYGPQPSVFSSPRGYRPVVDQGYAYPVVDQGYVYPVDGIGGGRTDLRQPDGVYDLGSGNGYGVYPRTFRNFPSGFVPTDGANGIYRQSPRGYSPSVYGYGQYPELLYPGQGLVYGRLRDNKAHGDKVDESVGQKGATVPYPQSSPSAPSAKGTSEGKTKSLRKEDP